MSTTKSREERPIKKVRVLVGRGWYSELVNEHIEVVEWGSGYVVATDYTNDSTLWRHIEKYDCELLPEQSPSLEPIGEKEFQAKYDEVFNGLAELTKPPYKTAEEKRLAAEKKEATNSSSGNESKFYCCEEENGWEKCSKPCGDCIDLGPAQPEPTEGRQEQDPCNFCGKTIREQMKGCNEIACYRQHLPKAEGRQGEEEQVKHRIAELLKNHSNYSVQARAYVIHGAIEAIYSELIEPLKKENEQLQGERDAYCYNADQYSQQIQDLQTQLANVTKERDELLNKK